MSDDKLADLREAAGDGAPLVDLAGMVGVSLATLRRWCRWVAELSDPDAPPTVPAIKIETLQTLHLSQPVELGDGEDSEHVRAVVAAIHEGRRDGRRELQRERRAIIEGNKWRTGNADRLRAIERALADLSASESSEPRG